MDMEQEYQTGVGGSGSGYYGGTTSNYGDGKEAGAGGSSFISGYEGCNAIDKSSTENNIIHTGKSEHYSGKIFKNGKILDGNSNKVIKRKSENGYAIITYLNSEYVRAIVLEKLI